MEYTILLRKKTHIQTDETIRGVILGQGKPNNQPPFSKEKIKELRVSEERKEAAFLYLLNMKIKMFLDYLIVGQFFYLLKKI